MPPASLEQDLALLRGLRFRRFEACAETVRGFHRLRGKVDSHPLADALWRVYGWLITPLTLQALDYAGLGAHLLRLLERGRPIDSDLALLLAIIDEPPTPENIAQMREHEEAVAEGAYDALDRQPDRFREIDRKTVRSERLGQFWRRIKRRYSRHMPVNARGVVRRTLARERGFDSRKDFAWSRPADRFQITFDALCYRWCLYGFEKDAPLSLKLTANPTPHGTMIFVPRLMSLDGTRTFVWGAINRIHRAHGARRQGRKLSVARMLAEDEAALAKHFAAEARRLGHRGDARYLWVLRRMGQPPNRTSWVKRLIYSRP